MAGLLYSNIYSGMIMATAEPYAPSGWLACDGTFKSSTIYADLFGAIGHIYNLGVDPGNGTFRLPDLNSGRAPIGASVYQVPGTTGGSNNHTHSFNSSSNSLSANVISNGQHFHNGIGPFETSTSGAHSHSTSGTLASGATPGNMPNAKLTSGTLATASGSHAHNIPMDKTSSSDGGHSHFGPAVTGFNLSGGHTHTANVTNSSVSASYDAVPHHLMFYIIKT